VSLTCGVHLAVTTRERGRTRGRLGRGSSWAGRVRWLGPRPLAGPRPRGGRGKMSWAFGPKFREGGIFSFHFFLFSLSFKNLFQNIFKTKFETISKPV
jgi:hypothetical protein